MLMVLVWSVIVKSGPAPVEYTAVCTFSGTGGFAPFVIVTQSGGWLVGVVAVPQPVWKTRGAPDESAVTLYIARNRRPVVLAENCPPAPTAAKWIVFTVSVGLQALPLNREPLKHSTSMVWGLGRMLPMKER